MGEVWCRNISRYPEADAKAHDRAPGWWLDCWPADDECKEPWCPHEVKFGPFESMQDAIDFRDKAGLNAE